MKTKIKDRTNFMQIILAFALMFTSVFMLSVETLAQHRDRGHERVVVRNYPRHVTVRPVRPSQTYAGVSVSGRNYFYSEGAFYKRDRFGYHVIVAPIGARIRVLPAGYLMFRLGALDYYYL